MASKHRTAAIAPCQKVMLTEFLRNHPELMKGTFSSSFTHQRAQELWEDIGEKLNAIPSGASKDWRKWRKTWQDLKKVAKTKLVIKKRDMAKTGGGPPIDIKIDDAIADLIDSKEVDGHTDVPEPEIVFDLVDVVPLKERPKTPDLITVPSNFNFDSRKPVTIETVIMEVDDDGGVEVPKEIEHNYHMEYPSGLPHKKINQTQRLQTSIKLGQQLLKGVNSRNDVMEAYYTKKMAYIEHKIEHDKKMLKAVENNTQTLNSLLLAVIASKHKQTTV